MNSTPLLSFHPSVGNLKSSLCPDFQLSTLNPLSKSLIFMGLCTVWLDGQLQLLYYLSLAHSFPSHGRGTPYTLELPIPVFYDASRRFPQFAAYSRIPSANSINLTRATAFASMRFMTKARKASSGSAARSKSSSRDTANQQKRKALAPPPAQRGGVELGDPLVQAQLKLYDEALVLFHQQKFQRAKQELEKVLAGPSKELADRARMHIRIAEQRMSPTQEQNPRTAEEHYQRGVAMMNLGRWDEARESLDRARKQAPKSDHINYARAALDCLTGEADSALANLKIAIELRPANRYHARNDEDFAFLQEDPRFTELLYPEKDGTAG